MRKFIVRLLLYTLLAVCILIFFGLSLMPLVSARFSGAQSPWRGYYSLLVRQPKENPDTVPGVQINAFEDHIARNLENAGISDVIYRGNATIKYKESLNTYGVVSVSQLHKRFDDLDPRMDDFMRRLDGYFNAAINGESWSVFYLPIRHNPLMVSLSLRKAFRDTAIRAIAPEPRSNGAASRTYGTGRSAYRLTGFRFITNICLVFVFSAFAFLVIRFTKFKPLLAALGALPFIVILLNGNIFLLCASALLFFCWAKLPALVLPFLKAFLYRGYRDVHKESPYLQLIVCAAALITSGFAVSAVLGSVMPALFLALSLAADFILFAAAFLVYLIKRTRFEHRPFFYQPLRRKPQRTRLLPDGEFILVGILAIFLILPLTAYLQSTRSLPILPQPQKIAGVSNFSPDSLEKLRYYETDGLPTLFDYFCHRAYQDSYYYGGDYGFPAVGSAADMTGYRVENGMIRQDLEPMVLFDEDWFERGIGEARLETSVTRLLVEQNRPVVSSTLRLKITIPGILYIVFHCISATFFFSHVLQVRTPLTAHGLYGIKVFIQRRKREAA